MHDPAGQSQTTHDRTVARPPKNARPSLVSNVEILDAVGVDDDVVIRARVSGTHRGVGRLPVNGALLVGVPPTGKSFVVQHIHWYRMKDGQIIDHKANRDDLGMLQQLGLLPALEARADLLPKARDTPG